MIFKLFSVRKRSLSEFKTHSVYKTFHLYKFLKMKRIHYDVTICEETNILTFSMLTNRAEKAALDDFLIRLCNHDTLESQEETLERNRTEKIARQKGRNLLTASDFNIQNDGFVKWFEKAKAQLNCLKAEQNKRHNRQRELRHFITSLQKSSIAAQWDDPIQMLLVEKGIVHSDESIDFIFKNGAEFTVEAE